MPCYAVTRVEKLPRFPRVPVLGSGLREYQRYSPDFSLRIMAAPQVVRPLEERSHSSARQETSAAHIPHIPLFSWAIFAC